MKKILLLLSLLLMIGCYHDDDNEKLILAKFIEILNDTEIINNYRAQRIYDLRLPIKIGSNTTYLIINE